MRGRRALWLSFALGVLLILIGGAVSRNVVTAGGVTVRDVGIMAEKGLVLRGRLHLPAIAGTRRVPAVLLIHGFANTREMQDPFAIELTRRGIAALSIDMPGHGASDGIVGAAQFGGPAALRYLRALPFVDPDAIGIEAHSLGGAGAMAAAISAPDGYRSIVLVGSSPKFAAKPIVPRNLALVLGRYEEFARLSWKVDRSDAIPTSPRLAGYFGVAPPVLPGRIYGDVDRGTGRRLTMVAANHPLEHLSPAAVAAVIDWFQRTLPNVPSPLPPAEQIWPVKEASTLAALTGALLIVVSTASLLLTLGQATASGADLRTDARRDVRWWGRLGLLAAVPAVLYFPAMIAGQYLIPGPVFPQWVQNQLVGWALACGVLAFPVIRQARSGSVRPSRWLFDLAGSIVAVGIGYAALTLSVAAFDSDFRFWIWALRPLDGERAMIAARYLPLWFVALLPTAAAIRHLRIDGESATAAMLTGAAATAGGMMALVAGEYGSMVILHRLATPDAPLVTILTIQLVPVLGAAGALMAVLARRTDSAVPGAALCALLLAWHVTGSTAIHWATGFEKPVMAFAAAR